MFMAAVTALPYTSSLLRGFDTDIEIFAKRLAQGAFIGYELYSTAALRAFSKVLAKYVKDDESYAD